ncbi:MAG: hypothetical protein AABY22_11525 [Nanoarchaeota archaeon]
MKDKAIVLTCDGGCSGHHLIFTQIFNPADSDPQDEIYITIHLDKLTFWGRLKWLFGSKLSPYGDFCETVTTKSKLQNIVNQLE